MADSFISNAREDKEFVSHRHEALKEREQNANRTLRSTEMASRRSQTGKSRSLRGDLVVALSVSSEIFAAILSSIWE
jgi:hypothetical protein